MSSFKRRARQRTDRLQSTRALNRLGLFTPEDVSRWARKHGLLSVFLVHQPVSGLMPACWQVVRPGYRTNPDAPAWQQGRKTFIYVPVSNRQMTSPREGGHHNTVGREQAEKSCRDWAASQFGVDEFVRIEGLSWTLFPDSVAAALQAIDSDIVVPKERHGEQTRRTARAAK